MAGLLTKDWFRKHPLLENSGARIGYSWLVSPDFEEKAIELMRDKGINPPDDFEREKAIAKEEDLDELIRWMRRGVTGGAKVLLRKKLLEREQEAAPVIKNCCSPQPSLFSLNFRWIFLSTVRRIIPNGCWNITRKSRIRTRVPRCACCWDSAGT